MTTEPTLAQVMDRLNAIEDKLDAAAGTGGVSLTLIAENQRRMMEQLGLLKADMMVLTGIVMRLDAGESGRRAELGGLHEQQARLRRMVEQLQGAGASETSAPPGGRS